MRSRRIIHFPYRRIFIFCLYTQRAASVALAEPLWPVTKSDLILVACINSCFKARNRWQNIRALSLFNFWNNGAQTTLLTHLHLTSRICFMELIKHTALEHVLILDSCKPRVIVYKFSTDFVFISQVLPCSIRILFDILLQKERKRKTERENGRKKLRSTCWFILTLEAIHRYGGSSRNTRIFRDFSIYKWVTGVAIAFSFSQAEEILHSASF